MTQKRKRDKGHTVPWKTPTSLSHECSFIKSGGEGQQSQGLNFGATYSGCRERAGAWLRLEHLPRMLKAWVLSPAHTPPHVLKSPSVHSTMTCDRVPVTCGVCSEHQQSRSTTESELGSPLCTHLSKGTATLPATSR